MPSRYLKEKTIVSFPFSHFPTQWWFVISAVGPPESKASEDVRLPLLAGRTGDPSARTARTRRTASTCLSLAAWLWLDKLLLCVCVLRIAFARLHALQGRVGSIQCTETKGPLTLLHLKLQSDPKPHNSENHLTLHAPKPEPNWFDGPKFRLYNPAYGSVLAGTPAAPLPTHNPFSGSLANFTCTVSSRNSLHP